MPSYPANAPSKISDAGAPSKSPKQKGRRVNLNAKMPNSGGSVNGLFSTDTLANVPSENPSPRKLSGHKTTHNE